MMQLSEYAQYVAGQIQRQLRATCLDYYPPENTTILRHGFTLPRYDPRSKLNERIDHVVQCLNQTVQMYKMVCVNVLLENQELVFTIHLYNIHC